MSKTILTLKAVKVNPDNYEKVDFTFARPSREDLVVTLKEKADWPIILNQPLDLVEKWFIQEYGELIWIMAISGMIDSQ